MKCTVLTSVILIVVMLACPLHLLDKASAAESLPTAAAVENIPEGTPSATGYDSFNILIDGTVQTLSAADYIRGVVAAEMPALYEAEALKAQAVAAYTFACYRKSVRRGEDFDLSDDPADGQSYTSDAAAREKWGEKADEYLQKITDAVQATEGMLLTYGGGTALTVYHAISPGTTVACRDVWQKDLPYLTEVDSTGDKLADGYLTTVEIKDSELAEKLSAHAKAEGAAADWFKDITVAASGRVISVVFCGTEVTGADIAEALGLRSASFEISYTGATFTFTVRGYGHGVGMSQTGANYMAKQGSDFKEILYHYYPGCKLNS